MRRMMLSAFLVLAIGSSSGQTESERTFDLEYRTSLTGVPSRVARLDLWLPYPQDDPHQRILHANVDAPHPVTMRTDPQYGNKIVHVGIARPPRSMDVTMRFRVRRREHRWPQNGNGSHQDRDVLRRWTEADRLVPLDARIKALAAEVTEGKVRPREKARAIYDYVVTHMRYDKSGTGWGNGDIYWACDFKRGNCTDFHALFIGLARASGIPAKFQIGFPLPADRGAGEIAGYHCWAEFYIEGEGWIPVDTSEANKNPSRREYFFGAHDEHRVQFSIGRDIILEPPQAGAPLNYFIYPYAEIDGRPFTQVQYSFSFRDVK